MKKGLQWALLVMLAMVIYLLISLWILGWDEALERIGRLVILY